MGAKKDSKKPSLKTRLTKAITSRIPSKRTKGLALADAATSASKFYWNVKKYPDVLKDIEMAKSTFDVYHKQGYTAYYLDAKGDIGKKMSEFDASAGSMAFL